MGTSFHCGSRGNYFQDENIQLFANSYHLKGSLISRMAEIELWFRIDSACLRDHHGFQQPKTKLNEEILT